MSLTRTEIAQGCGVTPALISYYFKDKRSLLDAVTKPLIKGYKQHLLSVIGSEAAAPDKMRGIIRLLIELNMENAFLVDYMLRDFASHQVEAEDHAVIQVFHAAISDLLREMINQGHWRACDVALAEIALWGMCRAFGEALRVQATADGAPDALPASLEAKVAFVFAAFAPEAVGAAPVA